MITHSPLESLAAFAIVFAAGVLLTVGCSLYLDQLKPHTPQSA